MTRTILAFFLVLLPKLATAQVSPRDSARRASDSLVSLYWRQTDWLDLHERLRSREDSVHSAFRRYQANVVGKLSADSAWIVSLQRLVVLYDSLLRFVDHQRRWAELRAQAQPFVVRIPHVSDEVRFASTVGACVLTGAC